MAPKPMTADLVAKVKALISRAAHATTPEPEARTSAVIACRLIAENDLDVVHRDDTPDNVELHDDQADDEPRARPRWIRSHYNGTCRWCGGGYRAGQWVCWVRGEGAAHRRCAWQWERAA